MDQEKKGRNGTPLLIAEGFYALMSGDKDRYGAEMKAIAWDSDRRKIPEGLSFVLSKNT